MKKYITFLSMILCCSSLLAKTITVSNNPNSPGQFTRLDSAILFAASGDILLVSGSVTDYAAIAGGTITVNKPLTLYGAGYDPRTDQALSTTINVLHLTAAANGSVISGFRITNQLYEDANTNSIVITRCNIAQLGVSFANSSWGVNGNNYDVSDNIIGQITINQNDADISFHNNIIYGPIHGQGNNSNVLIYNNYFTSTAIGFIANASIYNNIFYFKSTGIFTAAYTNTSNCVYNNNIYYNTSNANPLDLGISANSGSNNINANPDFVNIDLTSGSVTRLDNFNLKPGSIGTNAGTDGKNIGPNGGSIPIQYPYTGYSAIPVIDSMSISNPVIPPNGTLKVKFTAHANN